MKKIFFISIIIIISFSFNNNENNYQFAVLKYNGGGDWYSNPTSLKNLIIFCNKNLNLNINPNYDIVDVGSIDIFNYPLLYMTGHGNVFFNEVETDNLRNYLLAGGFLHIDDNYGMDKYIRAEMKKVFPELDFIELPLDHNIYNIAYQFENGLPKIHEHDNKPSQGLGLIKNGKLVCFYTYECDLGDGWEDAVVHNNSYQKRQEALKMGANIISFALTK